MSISHPSIGSALLVLLLIPILFCSCAVFGGRPKGVGLAGKRIVLDPGHGGEQLGAVGLNGLEEKTSNLWVAEKLNKMLEQDGADVYLTRKKDDQTVSLRERVDFTRTKGADLFVSLHHNANAQVDRTIDRSEVYYYWWNDGPSRDVADRLSAAFHRHLGLPQLPTRPAIYYVTRHNQEPCVLGEPSYISNPEREAKLRTEEHQQEEAQAYYEAIKEHFQGGVPFIESFHINDDVGQTGRLFLEAVVRDEGGGSGIDPAGIELTVDDRPVPHHFDPPTGRLTASGSHPLTNGPHTVFLMARNRAGNAAKPVTQEFTVDLPAASLQLAGAPLWAPTKGVYHIHIQATVNDPNGHPVADGKMVTFVTDRGSPSTSEDSTRDGRAGTTITVKEPKGKALVFATCGNLYNRLEIQFDSTCSSLITGTITSGAGDGPVSGAWIRVGDRLVPGDRKGNFLLDEVAPGPGVIEVLAPGYHRRQVKYRLRKNAGHHAEIVLEPLYGGLLLDKSVAIDAAAGGDEPGAVGPGGTKAADVNLRVARYLQEYLEAAGATVHMTRHRFVDTIDPVVRTRFVRDLKPNKLVSISYSNPYIQEEGSRCFHFYTDQEGKTLAEHLQKHLVSYLGRADLGVHEWSSYLMIEALVDRALATPDVITVPEAEERLGQTHHLRREAYALFCGLLEDFGLDMDQTGLIAGTIADAEGQSVEGALVVLDDALALQTGPDGSYRFSCVEPGTRTMSVYRDGYQTTRTSFKVPAGREVSGHITLTAVE
jgi:N-acetylmuramoyl-L-alanine amidase